MKNSLIVIGILVAQLTLTTKGALASVQPYLNEVRNFDHDMENMNFCSTRKLYARNLIENLNKQQVERFTIIASK